MVRYTRQAGNINSHKTRTAMTVKIHYRITQDRAGIPQDFAGARHFVVREDETIEDTAKHQLAADYQVPTSAVIISRIES
jgi:hypothetical protein